jgi:hypothetical protein
MPTDSRSFGPAIRRASQAARNAMQMLEAATAAALKAVYESAADQVRQRIEQAAAVGGTGQVELSALRELLAAIEAVLDAAAQRRSELVMAAIQRAAELGVQPFTAAGMAATGRLPAGSAVPGAPGGALAPILDPADALATAESAVAFVRSFRPVEDGLALSDRLWRVDAGAREAMRREVEAAVVRGHGADRAAAELLARGQAVPPSTREAQRANDGAPLARSAAELLRDPTRGPLANVLRVMRTEINRAHGEAYMVGAERSPGFVGFRFLLSPRHPRPDICDLLARQNLHGLGPGVYPSRQALPWPAHPNTLSFVVAVFEEEIKPEDAAGRETSLQALQRLAPEIRAGVLGPTKAGYFDQGLLSAGSIRSRVGAVQSRLQRQGRLPEAASAG